MIDCFGPECADFIICIDATKGMEAYINGIKEKLKEFPRRVKETIELEGLNYSIIRTKIIVFRNIKYSNKPFEESEFFNLSEQAEELISFIDSIKVEDVDYRYCNALEALAKAINQPWTTDGSHRKHVIMMFSYTNVAPLGFYKSSSNYPNDMPTDLEELKARYNGESFEHIGTFQPKNERLIMFTHSKYPWNETFSFHNSMLESSEISEVYLQYAIDLSFSDL